MVNRLASAAPDFDAAFRRLLEAKRGTAENVSAAVSKIIADVRRRGDAAVVEYTEKFDRLKLKADALRVTAEEIDAAVEAADRETVKALDLAAARIRAHHQRQRPADDDYVDPLGVRLGSRWSAVPAVGLYVPGGTASYPSSVLMNAIPAQVAGVERIVMVVPSPDGRLNALVLVAARLAGVEEIYRIGGAQAVAALAYGTQTIRPVDKIVGPGNAYVAEAKRQVFGQVGIDMIAGPSEVLVVADAENDPDWIAADLLAQAEHDEDAQAILVTDSATLADMVCEAVERQLSTLPRVATARESWRRHGAVIVVDSLDEAAPMVDAIAPEHLEIATVDPEAFFAKIRNAGAVFLGRYTPEVIGDYVGGSNHVLPTSRSARFSSGLSVLDYMKRSSFLQCGPDQLAALGPAAIRLAQAEGLQAHAQSVSIRTNRS